MRKRRVLRSIAFLVVVFIIIAGLASCENGSSQGEVSQTTTQANVTTKEAIEEKGPDLHNQKFTIMSTYDHPTAFATYWGTNDPNAYKYWPYTQAQCDTWLKALAEYNFTVETIIVPNTELMERLIAGEMAGQPVADLWTYHTGWYTSGNPLTAIKEGYMTPLDDLVNLDYLAFNPDYRPMYMYQGKTYGVAYRDSYLPPGLVVFANKLLLEDAGLDPKAIQDEALKGGFTWAKLQEYAEKVAKDTDDDGINDIMGFGLSADHYLEKFALSNNASPIKQSGNTYVSGLLDKPYLDAMDFLYNNAKAGIATLESSAFTLFGEGKEGFVISEIMQATNQGWIDKLGEDMMLLPLPKGPEAEDYVSILPMGVHAWYIPNSVDAERKLLIGKFLEVYINAYSGNLGEDPGGDFERAHANYQRTGVWMTWACRTVDDTRVFTYLDTLKKVNEFFLVIPGFNDIIIPTRGAISNFEETPIAKLSSVNDLWQKALEDFYGK